MSNVDDELAKALRDSEQAAPAVPAPEAPPPAARPKKPNRSVGLLVALLVMVAGILSLVFTSFKDSAIYAKNVDQVVAERNKLFGRNLRVQGYLKPGTLVRRDDPCEFRFTLETREKNAEIPVRLARCTVPDNFREVPGMPTEVTAEGALAEGGHVEATQVIAKCPTKYEMDQAKARGEAAPHGLVQAGTTPGL